MPLKKRVKGNVLNGVKQEKIEGKLESFLKKLGKKIILGKKMEIKNGVKKEI